ncbi:MAG: [protein-PII] uridylyltransferase [Desulfobulbaceae bacterium DB1]|nr:MAG: [protein-PII] uridylyltransferase [Desulfobulbaceae bacterium DB1]
MNQVLRAKRDALESLWRQGLSGHALLERHTSLMDSALAGYFEQCLHDAQNMSLVALGGYGREELFPYSDIDLMLLHDHSSDELVGKVAEAVFYPLWDAGLEVGHGVRTVQSCLDEADKDFFLQVSLLDARLIAGDETLLSSLLEEFRKKFIEGRRNTFLQDMLFHRQKRHQRFGNHSYLLEPHIKESRGGFRDIQAMLWSSQVIFSLKTAEDLERAGMLTADELARFAGARNTLIKIRNRLHYISGRKNDQLFFEHQEEMAHAFGYKDEQGMLGVERFMRDVHGHLQTIAVTTDLFFEHAIEVLGIANSDNLPRNKNLEKGLQLRQGRIHITDQEFIRKRPHLIMRAFYHAAKYGCPLHYRSKKMITAMLHTLDGKARNSKLTSRAFLETLQCPKAPLPALTEMLETGLLDSYLPEFLHLKSLAQHDIYHVYTVDRHLLQTVEEINRLRVSEHAIFITLASPHLLFLAALLHDIGKGQGKNHCEYGAELSAEIGARLALPEADIKCLAFLVREHLFLAEIAQRRDLEDEALIIRCARHIQDPDRLTMLYLLTVADAKATGPSAWSEWKAALLLQLYLKIANILSRDDLSMPDPAKELTWMRDQIKALQGNNCPVSDTILPDDYLQGNSPEEVVRHLTLHGELRHREVILQARAEEGHWSLLIMTHDRPGLLYKICGILALHNLQVLAAQIYTWLDGTVVDILHVASTIDNLFGDHNWQKLEEDLAKAIHFRLGLSHRLHSKLQSMRSGAPQPAKRPAAKVIIDTKASDNYTVIEVYAENRTGLLYDITRTLSDFGINTFRAKIGTKGDQIVDVFYVLDHRGIKIEDEIFQQEIRNGLLHAAA